MAALVSERFSSTGKLKVQLMTFLNFIPHVSSLLVDKMQIRSWEKGYNSLAILSMKIEYALF